MLYFKLCWTKLTFTLFSVFQVNRADETVQFLVTQYVSVCHCSSVLAPFY
jgi:hypothetical protein